MTTISIEFRIRYETSQGENIYVLGNSPLLGNWKNPIFKLHWSENHIWKNTINLPENSSPIKYKFVCINNNTNEKRWEEGPNRLLSANKEHLKGIEFKDNKYILNCIWNHFVIELNIYFPLKDPSENLQVVGEPPVLANWLREGESPVKMELSKDKEIIAKDGNKFKGKFWIFRAVMKITEKRNYDFEYRYSIYNPKTKTAVWEREPNRHLKLFFDTIEDNPEIEEEIKQNEDENKILYNSYLEHLDVNFVANLSFDKIGDKNIYIGPYPQKLSDFEEIAKAGINTILNVQTDKDIKHRQIDHEKQKLEAKNLGIEIVRFPIEDFNQEDLELKLKDAGDKLKSLLDKNKIVYVHCTAGMSRAAATVIIYLVLYDKEFLYDIDKAIEYVKSYRPIICPNYNVIKNVTEKVSGLEIESKYAKKPKKEEEEEDEEEIKKQ